MAESPVTQDPDAAQEFKDAYGFSGNAEQIIRANAQRETPELRRAARLTEDTEATKEMSAEDAASAAEVEPSKLRGHAVRGAFLVVVYEDESGSLAKKAVAREGEEVELTPEEQAEKAAADAEAKVLQASREARAAEEQAVEEARQKAQEESAEKVTAAAEEAAQEQTAAAEEAAKAEESSSTEAAPRRRRASSE
jgi:hypothetical protein